jgi:hypothetical protein
MTDPSSPSSLEEPAAMSEPVHCPPALRSRDMNRATTGDRDDNMDKQTSEQQSDRCHSSIDDRHRDAVAEINDKTSSPLEDLPVGKDHRLPDNVQQDPRGNGTILERMTQKATKRGNGRNTESFDPNSTLVRPDVRIWVGNPTHSKFHQTLKHDDVVVVPELFGPENDWTLYYQLVKELTQLQENQVRGSEFISWHEGSHLICKEPKQSKTFQMILKRLCDYFDIDATTAGTRFNWYKDSQDWKVSIKFVFL